MMDDEKRDDVASSRTPKKLKSSTVRGLVAAGVFVVVAVGLMFPTGTGTLSSMGINAIAAICPLGALESVFGSWTFVPRALIALAAMVLIVVVIGKAFCSWICPIPYVQNLFKTKKRTNRQDEERRKAASYALANWREGKQVVRRKVPLDSRHAVLGGALLSTAIFGFPVFCLVCPIGLTFATFILLWRFVQFNEPTWGLIIFPAIVILEVVVLRKWCGKICPMGALLSLASTLNRRFRPTVDAATCLRDAKGLGCEACAHACPEHIDPHADLGERPMTECVKCRSCAHACPVHAITLPFKVFRRPILPMEDRRGDPAAQGEGSHGVAALGSETGLDGSRHS